VDLIEHDQLVAEATKSVLDVGEFGPIAVARKGE
jgi:hypothetical protein